MTKRALPWLILLWIACFGASACTTTPTPSPTFDLRPATASPSPTSVLQPATTSPSPTFDLRPSIAPPSPTFTLQPSTPPAPSPSPLELAAQQYLAASEPEAIAVARRLNYLANDGHPSNMSGPLALVILRDAGVVSETVNLHDFWLLDPAQNPAILEATFPRAQFLWFQTATPLHQFDFAAFPLQAGDLLYVDAGENGTFSQFLVVTRLDADGRAYTVTSRNTPQGYVIDEMPVDDLFAAWTDRQNAALGLTGFGGFRLWRARRVEGNTPAERLAHAVGETLITYGGDWQVLIRQSGGETLFAHDAERRVHIASVIKIPIALLFLKSIEAQAGDDLTAYLDANGTDGRSYRQLLEYMLVRSEEDATASLEKSIETNGLDAAATLKSWGLAETSIAPRQSSAQDVAEMLAGLYDGKFVSAAARSLLLDLLNTYTPNDDSRLGSLRALLPGVQVYNKRGTLTEPLLIVADAALIICPQGDATVTYEVVVLARNAPDGIPATYEHLDQAIAEIARWFAQYLLEIYP